MCVICICKGRGLTEKEIVSAFRSNDDGASYAWQSEGKICYKKGFMKVEHIIKDYFSSGINTHYPHIVHFRNATNKVTAKLTHPFIISEKSPLSLTYKGNESLLFHNGVMSDWKNKMMDFYLHNAKRIPDGDFSDSRFIAILTHFLGPNILSILGDKYVVFGLKNIDLYGSFEENDNGIIASNKSYKTGNTIYTKSQTRALMRGELVNSNPLNICDINVLDDTPDRFDE